MVKLKDWIITKDASEQMTWTNKINPNLKLHLYIEEKTSMTENDRGSIHYPESPRGHQSFGRWIRDLQPNWTLLLPDGSKRRVKTFTKGKKLAKIYLHKYGKE